MKALLITLLFSCSHGPGLLPVEMPEWTGKSREEVKAAFTHLTPKTEENRITYRDSDPLPSSRRCAVIDCYPWIFGPRINCTYIFKFRDEKVIKATKKGLCR